MSNSVIMDLVVALVLLLCTLSGFRAGFIKSFASLVISLVALVGAAILDASLSGPVTNIVAPLIEEQVAKRVETTLVQETGIYDVGAISDDVGELLRTLGIDEDAMDGLLERAEEALKETGSTALAAVIVGLTRSVVYVLVFLLGFVGLYVLLHILAGAMDLVAHLPVLHTMNAFGGGALGLVKGALLVFLAVWFLRRLGVSLSTEAVQSTYLLKFFTDHTPLSALALLR